MIGYLKLLPYLLAVSALAGGAHWLVVHTKNTEIERLQADNVILSEQAGALRQAASTNIETIRELEATLSRQTRQISSLQATNNQLQVDRDQYMSIFRRHDLTRLSLARPGLIQNRINNGTRDVLNDLENATRPHESPPP